MSASGNVTLRLSMSGDKSVSARLDQLQGKTNKLEKGVEIRIGLDDKLAEAKISNIFHELEALNRSQATIKMKFPDYASAVAKLDELKAKTDSLDGRVIKEKIKIDGAGKALLEFSAIAKAADSAGKKRKGGSFNFPGPFEGVSGVGAGASAVAIEALTSPVGAGAAALALPFIGTGVGGGILGGLGAGLVGLGAAGALGVQNKNTTGQLKQAQGALHAALLRQTADRQKLNKLQASGKASTAQLAAAQGVLASASASVAGAQDRLNKVKAGGIKQDNAATNSLQNLEGQMRQSMTTIGKSFVPVLSTIFNTFNSTLKDMTPVFAAAEKEISGPFKQLGVILGKSLSSPQVVKSIQDVANAFSQFLDDFSPQIPGIVNSIAGGISGIATAFTDNPGMIQGMANVTDFLFKLPGYALSAIGALVRVTSWLTSGLPHEVSRGLDAAREFFINIGHDIESVWDTIFDNIKRTVTGSMGAAGSTISGFWSTVTGPFIAGFNGMLNVFKGIFGSFVNWWKANGDALKGIWDSTWMYVQGVINTFWPPIEGLLKAGLAVVVGAFKGTMSLIVLVWQTGWAVLSTVFKTAWALIEAGVKVGWAVISLLFKSSIGILVASWRVFWALIENVAKVTWTLVSNTLKGIWDIIVGIFTVFINLVTFRWGAALNAMKNLGIQIWNLTKNNLSAIWNAIKDIAVAIWNALKAYLVGLWNNTKSAAISIWNAVRGAVVSIWNSTISAGKSIWNSFFGWLRGGWNAVVGAARAIWGGIKEAVMSPVRWVVNNVWDPFANVIDTATNFLHLGRPLPIVHLATGGIVPQMVPGSGDRQPALLEAGETVVDKKRSKQFSRIFAMMGVPGYSTGGVVGGGPPINLHTGVSNSVGAGPGVGDIVNVGKTVVGFGKKLVQGAVLDVVKPAVNGLLSLLSHAPGANTAFGKVVTGLPREVANKFFDFIGGKDKAFTAQMVKNVGSGVARWAGLVAKALSMEGLPQSLARQVLYQMQTESGGNPNAINLTDVNAQRGDPSRGLLQTIGSTFRAYHWPGTSWNIYDPLANIAAAINYARHVYGPTLMSGGMGMGSGHGYAMGTSNATRGWHLVGERGPEVMWFNGGEKVIPHSRIRGGDGASQIVWTGNVVITGQAIHTKAEIGREVVNSIKEFEKRSGAGWRK